MPVGALASHSSFHTHLIGEIPHQLKKSSETMGSSADTRLGRKLSTPKVENKVHAGSWDTKDDLDS